MPEAWTRKRPRLFLTLEPETVRLLERIAAREGDIQRGKSRVVERLIREEATRLGIQPHEEAQL